MIIYTHLTFALLICMALLEFGIIEFNILGIIICVIGALLPDIDSKESIVGKIFKPVAYITEHRGFLHTIIFELIIGAVIFFTLGTLYFFMFKIGFLSHLFLDALNHKGIKPFHPIHSFRIKGGITTNGPIEFIMLGVMVVLMFLLTFY